MTHWGLKHWLFGIKEFIVDRCLCCARNMDEKDSTRAFIDPTMGYSTDCCCLVNEEGHIRTWTNNPLGGSICLPFAMVGHVCFLPVMCFFPTRDKWQQFREESRVDEKDGLIIPPQSYTVYSTQPGYFGCPDQRVATEYSYR